MILQVGYFLPVLQDGQLPVINDVITPISGVITPVTHLFLAIYRGEITPFITGRGPSCMDLKWNNPKTTRTHK